MTPTPTPTPIPEIAQAAATLDPTALALLSIFGGVVLTVIAGFIGAWIQARREHKKWLREQRYEAFIDVLALMKKIVKLRHDGTSLEKKLDEAEATAEVEDATIKRLRATHAALHERIEDAYDRFDRVIAPMQLLGPSLVESTLSKHVPQLGDKDEAKADAAEKAIVTAMRKSLGVLD